MRAEVFRPDAPDRVLGAAEWRDGRVRVETSDEPVRAALGRIFHPSAVAVDDPALRPPGARGPVVVEAGDLEWFRAAALSRGPGEGFGVRFVTHRPGGWDPALDPQTFGWAGRKPALPREP